jgi:hypothetical protein
LFPTAGGALSLAYDGNALGTIARVKQQIMLHGGVLTSLAKLQSLEDYPAFSADQVYDVVVKATDQPQWHAVFCYGWADAANNTWEGWWLCKNRCVYNLRRVCCSVSRYTVLGEHYHNAALQRFRLHVLQIHKQQP